MPFLLGDWWERGSGPPQEPGQHSWPHDLWTQAAEGGGAPWPPGAGARTEREYPAEIIVPLVGGQGDAASQSRIGTATYNFAPSHSLFLNDNLIKLRSHLRKGSVDLDGKQTISLHASCFLPPTPTHLSQTVTWDTRFPLSLFSLVHPASRGCRWRGRGGAGSGACVALAAGTPGVGVSPARLPRLSLCSRLPRLHPSPSPHVPECARQHPVVFPCRAWLPASLSLCVPLPCKAAHTPARLSRSSLWFSLHCFAPSGLLLLESPGELVWVSVCLGGPLCPHLSRMACDAAGPSGHLGHVCEFVAPPPCCCLGPPAFRPLSRVLNLRVPPFPPPRGGWSPALLWI